MRLSVVVITLNEERNIGRCLDSVQRVADEIVIVDSGSTDDTMLICKKYGVRFIHHRFQNYGLQKNFAAREASNDFILSLDADEALSDRLCESIRQVKLNRESDCYSFNRVTNFCGRWILHGEWYPDKSIRLFDRQKALWYGSIHEKLIPDNPRKVVSLEGELLHFSCCSMRVFLHKTEQYAFLEARDLFYKNVYPCSYHLYIKPVWRFFSAFVLRKGFLDGYAGYQIAKATANRVYLRFDELKNMHEQERPSQEDI